MISCSAGGVQLTTIDVVSGRIRSDVGLPGTTVSVTYIYHQLLVANYELTAQIAIWLPGSLPDVRLFLFFLYCVYVSGK